MSDFVPPVKTKNFLQRLNVVGFESFEITSIQRSGFTAKEKTRDAHGAVDCNLGRDGQIVVCRIRGERADLRQRMPV